VQALHPQGVQKEVQKCGFVRGSRGSRNPMVAPCRLRPATFVKSRDIVNGCLATSSIGASTGCSGGLAPELVGAARVEDWATGCPTVVCGGGSIRVSTRVLPWPRASCGRVD
jgi:hypothetical protein